MRDYSKVSAQFWTGKTGRNLRGDMQSQIVALYLMTSPHSNMIGVFHCPAIYIAHETGSPLEGALKGLQRLIEGGFCTYDHESETVWVHEMAKFQIGCTLKASDNRVKDVQKQYEGLPEGQIRQGFYAKYCDAYHLVKTHQTISPLEAPWEALRSQEQEQEQEQDNKTDALASVAAAACPADALVSLYHELMPDNPRCKVLSAARRGSIRSRWKEAARLDCKPFGYSNREEGLAAWRAFFEICADSHFLTGRTQPQPGKPPFVADIDFLMSPSGFARTLENKYHREAA